VWITVVGRSRSGRDPVSCWISPAELDRGPGGRRSGPVRGV